MPLRCRLCDARFADHVVVHARSSIHWRGKSFDAQEVRGAIGLRVMEVLDRDADDPRAMDAFLEETHVEAFREDPMGVEPWQGEKDREEGEDWEFHLGFREPLDEGAREPVAEAARQAVEGHGNFGDAKVVLDGEAVEEVPAEGAQDEDGDGEPAPGAAGEESETAGEADEDGDEAVDSWTHPDVEED